MLKVIHCRQPEEKRTLFQNFRPDHQTWIVSDLQSKWHLQKQVLDQHSVLQERTILRATELWKHFTLQLAPEVQILSSELAQTLFWNWLEPMELPWARSPQAVPILIHQMQMWISIFADPRHNEIMAQWFRDNPESYVRWGHWFELCAEIWRRCHDRRLILASWLPAILLNEDLTTLRWSRELIFDLGSQISQVEGVLIRELARVFDVTVIFPEAPWIALMRNALRPYDELLPQKFSGNPDWQPEVDESLEFGRFSTQLAEVKDAVAKIRTWLDAGVEPRNIALVAPDIEHYWPALSLYLQEEGIPVAKPVTARLGGFVEMAQWLATLRTALAKISSEDLQVYFFTRQYEPRLSFDRFRVLFSHIYGVEDLQRAEKHFSELEPAGFEPQTLREFLFWAMRFWSELAETDRLLILLQVMGREVPPDLSLKPAQWLSYLEGLLARREVQLTPAHEEGISCVSVSSSDWLELSHALFLNLSEGALRRQENSPVTAGEAQKIFTDTGFALGTADRQELEFEFLWFLQRPWQALKLNFSGTDFSGSVLTPARLWMWSAFCNDRLKTQPEMPGTTRWDEIQQRSLPELAHLREWSEDHLSTLTLGLERDHSNVPATWGEDANVRVSASSLEKFWECPFIFAATRKLKLNDDPALDLDLDRRTRGALLHALVEVLLEEPLTLLRSEHELKNVIEVVREKSGIQLGDERFWPAVRAQHMRLAQLFLKFEAEWRERFPATTTVARELPFECYWDLNLGQPTAEKTGIVVAGRLDRVDRDAHGRYALIDYKGSAGSFTNWASWLKNREIQLALYAQLIEQGLMSLESGPVVAANYYVIKDSERRRGYHVKEADCTLYSFEDRHRNWITAEQKAELFAQLRAEIQAALLRITRGELNPHPENPQTCAECSWRALCRAPHLN